MASSSSSSGNYEVFLNFRGEDTRRSFTCYLYDALNERKKIRTFIDDEGLGRGDEISDALLNAIQGSKISVVIFSKDYASSKWCLNELVKILECKNTNGQIVIPVFYGVSPSNVRHQEETFGNGFKELKKQFEEKAEMVLKWKNALTGTSHLAGLESTKFRNNILFLGRLATFKSILVCFRRCTTQANKQVLHLDFVKLERFDGGNFIRWQKKLHFLLTSLNVVYVLTTPKPQERENETLAETRVRHKWEQDDYVCKGHICNAMSDTLFDQYHNKPTSKEIWDSLEAKYMMEDATSKKFLASKFFNYRMVDNRLVVEQYNEILHILDQFNQHNMKMDESIIVSSIIDKLPPSWKDYKKSLKHNKEEISLDGLGQSLRIEEELKLNSLEDQTTMSSKINVVEEGKEFKHSNHPKNNQKRKFDSKENQNNKKKKKGTCHHCGKPGHFKRDCRLLKKQKEVSNTNLVAMIFEINVLEDDNAWWIDSGATKHVCKDRSLFKSYKAMDDGSVLYMGNSSTAIVKGKGNVQLEFTSGKTLTLTDVYHVPEVRKNLVSGSLLNKFGFKLVFESNKFILSKGGTFVGKRYMYEGMFKLNINNMNVSSAYMVDSLSLWHNRLGHVNVRRLHDMANLELIPKHENDMHEKCKVCAQTKITRSPFPKIEKTSSLLHLIRSDVCDMHSNPSKGGKKYFVTFIDDFSKYCYVYLLHSKDQVLEKFKTYKNEVENFCDTKIKCLRSDKGGEYAFSDFCESVGIVHETSTAYTPQQNGVAERKNRTLIEMVNAMLFNAGLGKGFWGEAILTACHILNRVPNKKTKVTPYELWKKKKPNLSYLRVWGCRAIVRLPEPKIKKLGERGIECIFLGYAEHSKAYRFLVTEPNSFVEINIIVESRDAIFYENRFSTIPKSIDSQENDKQIEIGQKRDANNEQNHLRRSKRIRTLKSFGPDFIVYLVEGTRDSQSKQTMITSTIESDPLTYEEAMKSQDAAFWKEAINDEMDSIVGNKTWKLVDLPPGSNPIGCKWIFKKKKKVDGTIERFKARLVAKGFTQKEGLDYFDTYAPVARIATIRVLIALASIYQFEIHQMNVKTAFLNGELDEEIYMKQPEGFVMPGQEHKVCKLVKSLYGLKQAPKQWHEKFDKVIVSNGFNIHESDKCVYSRFNGNKGVIICLYVDDMLIFGTDSESIELTKLLLSSNFDMKDMGLADVILGIKIIKNENGLVLTQSHYIEKILKKFYYYDCKSVSTPFDSNIRLYPNTGRSVSQLEYARIIGCLMYAMTCTRPDIAFAVGKLSIYTSNPSQAHWQAVYRILKYLKYTMDYGIYYTGYPLVLEGFSDASWITDRDDHTSTSGWIFNLGGEAISWGSKKQTCIADSTMAAEFVALASCCKEAEWLRNLLIEIPIWSKPMPPVSIHCDSEATLSRAYSQIYNGKSRHIGLRHSYACNIQEYSSLLSSMHNASKQTSASFNDAQLVNKIVEDVLKNLEKATVATDSSNGLVGLNSRIEQIKPFLCMDLSDTVQIVGIWGMGGIGKTTLATAIFNQFSSEFEGRCFLSDIRKNSETGGGKILSEKLEVAGANIPHFTKERVRRMKVLIVLDDVNEVGQLEGLIGELDQFGPGSRIVVTTRDKRVLEKFRGEKKIYRVNGLEFEEAFEHFCNFAFEENHCPEDLNWHSQRVVEYADGNPLVPKVLGSSLCLKRKSHWENLLHDLNRICESDIHDIYKKLKITFDELTPRVQSIFLDIACFFEGEDKDFVARILDDSESDGLDVLIDKSLISISGNCLQMHDLLQEMGQQIVRQESEKEPGKRSRLCDPKEIRRVLKHNKAYSFFVFLYKGTDAIEGISLDLSKIKGINLDSGAFTNMSNLRLLKFYVPKLLGMSIEEQLSDSKVLLPDGLDYLPKNLRYLHWDKYPLRTLPSNFKPENLVELNLHFSKVEQLWEGKKEAFKLKSINLSHCRHFIDMSYPSAPNLETYLLDYTNFACVPSSIQNFKYLSALSFEGCKSLRSFPSNFRFVCPVTINFSSCVNLIEFPQISGKITRLYLGQSAIEEVPSSIECLTDLEVLDLRDCKRLKRISTRFCKLRSLVDLFLHGCLNLQSLPALPLCLKSLDLRDCKMLQSLPELPSCLEALDLTSCNMVRSLPKLPLCLKCLYLRDCKMLQSLPALPSCLKSLDLGDCKILQSLPAVPSCLKSLDLRDCKMLQSLPALPSCLKYRLEGLDCKMLQSLLELPSCLESLDLTGCNMVRSLPALPLCLKYLYLKDCKMFQSLPALPSCLKSLDLRDCKMLQSLPALPSCLESLDLTDCNMFRSLPALPSCLKYLYLRDCKILQSLPALPSCLKSLDLRDCKMLQSLPALPSCLKSLDLRDCKMLQSLPTLPSCLESLDLTGCNMFRSLPELPSCLKYLYLRDCKMFRSLPTLPLCLQSLNADNCNQLQSLPEIPPCL
ncbi:hypothetical protein KPL70_008133 [Citrus sinensis]|nr:hypothetical protein KPL70_008133 [Citrus sinensis]